MKQLHTSIFCGCLLLLTFASQAGVGKVFPGSRAFLGIQSTTISEEGMTRARVQPEYAFFGIYSSNISKEKAAQLGFDNAYGSYVTGIIGNTAAARGGFRAFDYVFGVDEYRTGAEQNLTAILRKYKPGDQATIHYLRDGKKRVQEVAFGRRADAVTKPKNECEDPFLGVKQSGTEGKAGISVSIVGNSTADAIGLKNGVEILRINGYRMIDWTDIGTAVDNLQVGDLITVEYLEAGKKKTASGPVKSYCETKPKTNKLFDWDFNFNFDREFDFDGNRERERGDMAGETNRDITGMKVAVGQISAQDAGNLKTQTQLDLPTDNNLQVDRFKLTPNTATGKFQLTFFLAQRGPTIVRLFNSAGRQIYEYDLGNFSGDFSDEIDLSQNGPNDYYLLIWQNKLSFTRKITLAKG